MKALLILIGCAVLSGVGITYAGDGNSEQAQFDARVEQSLSDYNIDAIVAKNGNLVTLTLTLLSRSRLVQEYRAAIEPFRAKFVALNVLQMDADAAADNPSHKPAAFIKVVIREPGGWIICQAIEFQKDYANPSALEDALKAALNAEEHERVVLERRYRE
jgi:hypothetical protein